jgi:hypothetical protein
MRNKSLLTFLVLIISFAGGVMSGWAKKPPSPEKIAKINRKWAEDQAKYKLRLGLSCPLGGAENVVIYPELGRQFEYWNGGGVKGFMLRRYVMVHRAKNPYTNMTLDITNGGEKVIENLCPGGSITLVQSMAPIVDGWERRVQWTAEGIVDGRLAYGDSSPGVLYQGWYNHEATAMRPTWVMDLNRVDKKF